MNGSTRNQKYWNIPGYLPGHHPHIAESIICWSQWEEIRGCYDLLSSLDARLYVMVPQMTPIMMIRTIIDPTMITPVVSPIMLGSTVGVGMESVLSNEVDAVAWNKYEVVWDADTVLDKLINDDNNTINKVMITVGLMKFFISTASIT